ncbi:hypothetical protein [Fusibacter bizertensis]
MKIYDGNYKKIVIGKIDNRDIYFDARSFNGSTQNFFIYMGDEIDFETTLKLTLDVNSNNISLSSLHTPESLRKKGYAHAAMSCLDSAITYINDEIRITEYKNCLINKITLNIGEMEENQHNAKTTSELIIFYGKYGFKVVDHNEMVKNIIPISL